MALLQDKIVVITGASRGIGRATALASAKQGAHLVLHYLGDAATTTEVESLKKEIEALGRDAIAVPGDISDAAVSVKVCLICALLYFGERLILCPFFECM